jgi:hypothetical protein
MREQGGAARQPRRWRRSRLRTRELHRHKPPSADPALGHDLAGRVAVNCLRIDVPVWSEGFDTTLSGERKPDYEDPVIISDAVLWLIRQPITHTAKIHSVTELRAEGIVRPRTRV